MLSRHRSNLSIDFKSSYNRYQMEWSRPEPGQEKALGASCRPTQSYFQTTWRSLDATLIPAQDKVLSVLEKCPVSMCACVCMRNHRLPTHMINQAG